MKQGKPLITLVMVIFALTIGVYFGSYVFQTFNEPYTTTHTYAYTHTESVQANGVLIREEQVIPAQPGIVELQSIPEPGRDVLRRQRVVGVGHDLRKGLFVGVILRQ